MPKVIYWSTAKGDLELTAQDIIDLGPFESLVITALEVETLEATESIETPLLTAEYVAGSVGAALAATGTTRDDALQLAAQINEFATAAEGSGCILPGVTVGTTVTIFNGGAGELKVYGLGSATIDGVAGATGVPLTEALRCAYTLIAEDTWISAQLGAVSS